MLMRRTGHSQHVVERHRDVSDDDLPGRLHECLASRTARDGAIGVIVGVAGLTTALRTRHALAMLVTGIAAIGMQVLSFAIDEHHERVHPLFEVSHALVPVILALIAVFAMRRAAPVEPPDRGPGLRAVR